METKDTIQTAALEAIGNKTKAAVGVTMGGGKTLIGLKHMNAHYNDFAKFLVTAPKRSVFNEWKSQAVEHGLAHLVPHMEFTTYRSLPNQSSDYDVVYLDECHSLLPSHRDWLLDFGGKIIGLSGTLPADVRSERGKLVAEFCPPVYTYDTDEAISDNILNDYQILIHKVHLNIEKTIKVENAGRVWYTSEVANYEYWTNRIDMGATPKELQISRIMRMKHMMNFNSKGHVAMKLLKSTKNKTILFANSQQQADDFGIPSYHSSNTMSEQNLLDFKEGKIMQMSAVLQLNEGVNIPKLKEGIIMHAYGNERKSAQRIGRLLRLNPKEKATIHILCYAGTVDVNWVRKALENFDQSKIKWL